MLDLAVVESRWWEKGNVSVRGLFEVIAAILKAGPDAYHYEMFNNRDSLKEIVPRIAGRGLHPELDDRRTWRSGCNIWRGGGNKRRQ